jgi:protein TonB
MRRLLAAALLAAAATPLGAEPPAARKVASPSAAEVDLVPTPPSAAERIEVIRARVQAAVVYPRAARERGIEGVARIQFRVDVAGRAAEVITVESSGSALLDAAAEQAARDARELPQIYGWVRIPLRFTLRARQGRGDAG